MERPLVPSFLNKLDKKLLLNKPDTWSTRVHLVVWYGFLFMAVLALICMMAVSDLRAYTTIYIWIGFVVLASFIGLVAWLIFLLRFNVFKRFGVQKPGDGLKTYLLFFVCALFLVLPSFVPPAIESLKANMAYGNDEIVSDVNSINERLCQLNYSILPTHWDADTFRLARTASVIDNNIDAATEEVTTIADTIYTVSADDYHYVDGEELDARLLRSDSTVELTDSLYVIYSCPKYDFVTSEEASLHAKIKLNSSADIYHSFVKNFQPVDVKKKGAELSALLDKYRNDYGYNGRYYDNDDYPRSNEKLVFYDAIRRDYNLYQVNTGISNICNKKYRWEQSRLSSYFRVLFYFTFYISLIVFIFRHTTIKTFFLTILAGVVLCIFSGLMIAFFANQHEEGTILGMLLFYYALFFVWMLSINAANVRIAMKGIALNLVTLFTSVIPLTAVGFYYETIDRKNVDYTDIAYRQWLKAKDTHFIIAEVAGVILFIIILEPLFKKLYRKWYALPEN